MKIPSIQTKLNGEKINCACDLCNAACCKYIYTARCKKGDEEYYWVLRGAILGESRMIIPCRCSALIGNKCDRYLERPELCKRFPEDIPEDVLRLLGCYKLLHGSSTKIK